jgi:hypothetical protein
MSIRFVRRTVPLAVTFLVGMLMIADYFLTFSEVKALSTTVQRWVVVISTVALALGVANITILHGRAVLKRQGNWILSLWQIFIMWFIVIMGSVLTTAHPLFRLVFDNMYLNPYNTVVTLLCFSTFAAGYRALKIRTPEIGVFFVCAVFLMLMLAPIGEVFWGGIPIVGRWIADVPSVGSMRGLMVGAAVGLVAVGIKTLLGFERGWLGRD